MRIIGLTNENVQDCFDFLFNFMKYGGVDFQEGTSEVYGVDYLQYKIGNSQDWIDLLPISAITGPRGEQGEKGNDGADGLAPQIQIGTVTTLEPDTEAYVELIQYNNIYTINFGIPKGETVDVSSINTSINELKAIVGDNTNGLVKDVADLKAVSDSSNITEITYTPIVTLTTDPTQYLEATGDVSITLPTITDDSKVTDIRLFYYSSSAYNITFTDDIYWGNTLKITAGNVYEFLFKYVKGKWLAGCPTFVKEV